MYNCLVENYIDHLHKMQFMLYIIMIIQVCDHLLYDSMVATVENCHSLILVHSPSIQHV